MTLKHVTLLIANQLSTWNRVFPEEITGSQRTKNFSAFYGTGKFITTLKKWLPVPILSHINPVYAQSYFLKFHFSIKLQSTLPSSKWSPFLWSLHKNSTCNSSVSHKCYMPRPSHSSWKDQQNVRRNVHVMKLLVMWSSLIIPYFVFGTPKYLQLHPFLENLTLCPSLCMSYKFPLTQNNRNIETKLPLYQTLSKLSHKQFVLVRLYTVPYPWRHNSSCTRL